MTRRRRVRKLASQSFEETDRELQVSDVTPQIPVSGYVTPRYSEKRIPVSDDDFARASQSLTRE
jgi:hypothetical protein